MTKLEELIEWYENEKANNGLLDFKLFPKMKFETIEELASRILSIVNSENEVKVLNSKEWLYFNETLDNPKEPTQKLIDMMKDI